MESSRLDTLPVDQQHRVRKVTANLQDQFAGTFGPETIERFVVDSLELLLPTAKVTTFLPVLAESFTKDRLQALGKTDGSLPSTIPGVLFLCVHNAGRSQMAAGWLRHLTSGRVTVYWADPSRRRRSTPPRSQRWPKWASTSPPSSPNRGPTRSFAPQMW